MRRSVLILTVTAAVVLGAGVPALTAAAQFVSDQLVDATAGQVVATADQVVVTTDQLVPVAVDLTGLLIDSACNLSRAAKANADHTKCAIACAQKGGRLALLTPGGAVYMVIGILTQDNNAQLIPFINRAVVLTGTVGTRVQDINLTTSALTFDNRRLTGSQDEVVSKIPIRQGDFREGDLPRDSEQTIDAISVRLPLPPGKQ